MRSFLLFTLAAMTISVGDTVAKPPSAEFKVGEPFPSLVLPSLADGKPLSLAQFRGEKVILHIFASW